MITWRRRHADDTSALEASSGSRKKSNGRSSPKVERSAKQPGLKKRCSSDPMFGHMFRGASRLVDLRRRALSQIEVIADQRLHGPLMVRRLAFPLICGALYIARLLPLLHSFGSERWKAAVASGNLEARAGGAFAEVSWAWPFTLSILFVSIVPLALRRMEKRPVPVGKFVFEFMAVYNCVHCLLNLYCLISLLSILSRNEVKPWGNELDALPHGHELGFLIWLQYHCRQLELLDTAFMVLRKKFQRISVYHIYLRVLNLWGWFFACRFACGGDTYFPTLITSGCQTIVYLYYSLSLLGIRDLPLFRKAYVTEIQIAQFVVCAIHSIFTAFHGHFPRSLAALHLFVIANGLVLYLDFHEDPKWEGSGGHTGSTPEPRVIFSFDSCGWLMVYHFGVAAWISEHVLTGVDTTNAGTSAYPMGVAFSGSSGGALIASVTSAGINVRAVFEFILTKYPECRRNPTRMFPAVEEALRQFIYDGACDVVCNRLRVLLTRVRLRPPFVTGEVVQNFPDQETSINLLCASCHVPVAAGILPRRVGDRYYYDGMAWPSSVLVPWRGTSDDRVVRVSACGAPLSDIRIPSCPVWWGLLPPPPRVLRGIFWCGYRDAAIWFRTQPEQSVGCCSCRMRPARDAVQNRGEQSGPGLNGSPSSRMRGAGSDADQEVDEGLKWLAAQALLRKQPGAAGQEFPSRDPDTGEDVRELIADFQACAERSMRRSAWAAALLVVLALCATIGLGARR